MITLAEARERIGDGVVYRTAYGRAEDGVITSVSQTMVFVRYGSDQTSQGTDPQALTFLSPGGGA